MLILGGEVHFGRIAAINFVPRSGRAGTALYEVISSPLAVLDSAESQFDPQQDEPRVFPLPEIAKAESLGAPVRIDYRRVIPSVQKEDYAEDNFMTLGFSRESGRAGVRVYVSAYLPRRPMTDSGAPPERAWTETLYLDPPALGEVVVAPSNIPLDGLTAVLVTAFDKKGTPVVEGEAFT